MFLLDTNVVSELRKDKRADASVLTWASGLPASSMFLSVITLMELETGVLIMERRDPAQARGLRRWLDDVARSFATRLIAVDEMVALRCARLNVPDRKPDRDGLIAATALVRGFTLVTRNVADFAATNVPILNPWRSG